MIGEISIVQHNVNKSRIASLQLRDYCTTNHVDLILLQEPLIQKGKIYAFEE